jgi:hypothetical protein
LTAQGVVIGKSMAQILRAFTLWMSMLPVLTIPFLTGGVSRSEALRMVTIEFCAAVICMAAGLAASALGKTRNGAFLMAYALAALGLAGVAILEGGLSSPGGFSGLGDLLTAGVSMATGVMAFSRPAYYYFAAAQRVYVQGGVTLTTSGGSGGFTASGWSVALFTSVIASGLLFYLAVAVGAAAIRRLWKDEIASPRRQRLRRRFCTPLFRGLFRRQMQQSLDRNPIAWLQQYSWKARASKWGLCGAFILMESYLLARYADSSFGFFFGAASDVQHLLAAFLAVVFTFVGVSGFLSEKRSGALELLLVTPVSVNRIILGRAIGLWKQFLPAAAILLLGEIAMSSLEAISGWHWAMGRGRSFYLADGTFLAIFVAANAFVALPIFATYCALRIKNLIGAAALTWGGLVVSFLMGFSVADTVDASLGHGGLPMPMVCAILLAFNAGFVALTFFLLKHSLSRRIYSF